MTEIVNANDRQSIAKAVEFIRQGRLVAFPTDTVYGIGADIANPAAINRLFQAKKRPKAKGIPVLLADEDAVDNVAISIPVEARECMKKYWPGPLTLILLKNRELPACLSPNRGIAVRVPDNDIARRFIRNAGGAVAATSANVSGSDPALNAHQVVASLGSSVALVLDGGEVRFGLASTIVDFLSQPPRIIRSGPIMGEELGIRENKLL